MDQLSNLNAQLYSGIAQQNLNELTGDDQLLNMLGQLGLQYGTEGLVKLLTKNQQSKSLTTQVSPQPKLTPSYNQVQGSLSAPSTSSFFNQNTSLNYTPTNNSLSLQMAGITPKYQSTSLGYKLDNPLSSSPSTTTTGTGSTGESGGTSSSATTTKSSLGQSTLTAGAGMVGGYAGGAIGSKLGSSIFGTDTSAGRLASGMTGQIGSMIGSQAASSLASTGSVSLSGLGSGASLGQGALAAANIALDALDPVKKSKGENILGLGAGTAATVAAMAGIPVAGWIAGGALLATNIVGHAFGKKTRSFTQDDELVSKVGSSYGGAVAKGQEAEAQANTKYSAFNNGARVKANAEITEAARQQQVMSLISDRIDDLRTASQNTSSINENRRKFNLQGGYNQDSIRVGRQGMSIELLNKARNIIKAQKGRKLTPIDTYKQLAPKDWEIIPLTGKPAYNEWVKDVNPDFINENYDLETAYNNLDYNQMQKWKFAVNSKNPDYYLNYHEDDYYPFHTSSVVPLSGTEDYIFLKKGTVETNPELQGELNYYNNSRDFKEKYNLSYEGDRYYYRKKKSEIKQETPQHKNGGSIIELVKESIIELVNPEDILEFKQGGSINIIPDGALHARKHNMENADNLTKKGIPVVDNRGEQQAEIEKEELIFRLEVTQKLEKLEKKYFNEETSQKEKDELALEAGKLIIEELLYNTKDNVGIL